MSHFRSFLRRHDLLRLRRNASTARQTKSSKGEAAIKVEPLQQPTKTAETRINMVGLPAELVLEIVKYLVPRGCIFVSARNPRMRWVRIRNDNDYCDSIQFTIDLMTLTKSIALECAKVLYGENTFRSLSAQSTKRFFDIIGLQNAQRLKHFQIDYHDIQFTLHFTMLKRVDNNDLFRKMGSTGLRYWNSKDHRTRSDLTAAEDDSLLLADKRKIPYENHDQLLNEFVLLGAKVLCGISYLGTELPSTNLDHRSVYEVSIEGCGDMEITMEAEGAKRLESADWRPTYPRGVAFWN